MDLGGERGNGSIGGNPDGWYSRSALLRGGGCQVRKMWGRSDPDLSNNLLAHGENGGPNL